MKEISSQLYGLSNELNMATSEDNGTTCFCIDTGTIFVAYAGIWHEQRSAFWATSLAAPGESQLYGFSYELDKTSSDDLTTCFAVDNGAIFVAYNGLWFEQPAKWADVLVPSAPELPEVDSTDAGKVLTVSDDGEWEADTPSGGGGDNVFYIHFVYEDDPGEGEPYMYTVETAGEIFNAFNVDEKTLVAVGFGATTESVLWGEFDDSGVILSLNYFGLSFAGSDVFIEVGRSVSASQTDPTKPFAFIGPEQRYAAELTPEF